MSTETMGEPTAQPAPSQTPLWLQGRDAVVAATPMEHWRKGRPPSYKLTDEVVPEERITQHEPGSLELLVEDLVRVFEMEASHKGDPTTWESTSPGRFRNRINGGPWSDEAHMAEVGTYNSFIGETPWFKASEETFDSSHRVFHRAMSTGFFWEVLEVFSGPPNVTFTWRHWGRFKGPFKGNQGTGEMIEVFGMTLARLDDDLKLVETQHYYDQNGFLAQLAGAGDASGTEGAEGTPAGGCPVAH